MTRTSGRRRLRHRPRGDRALSCSRATSGRWAGTAWSAATPPTRATSPGSWTASRPTSSSPTRPTTSAYQSADGKSIQNDSMADGKFYEFLLAAFRNMAAHLAEGGSAYVFHADTEGLNFRRAFKEAGFHISGVCIWVKNSLVLGRSPYQWQHEPVLFGWLPNGKHKWFCRPQAVHHLELRQAQEVRPAPDDEAHPAAGLSHPEQLRAQRRGHGPVRRQRLDAHRLRTDRPRLPHDGARPQSMPASSWQRYIELTGGDEGVCVERAGEAIQAPSNLT